jgi:hypothetical protein
MFGKTPYRNLGESWPLKILSSQWRRFWKWPYNTRGRVPKGGPWISKSPKEKE